ncbi:MAG: WYL domain-containing protein [Oscillospiraceae bacterium]|nr:WYL domain-containing protein [Oscillospiraceae bacterium]
MFSGAYSAYFNAVAAILREAVHGGISKKRITEIISVKAFSESFLTIIPALQNEEWLLMNRAGQTPIQKPPQMPLTILQKRWLKTLITDPRIALFAPDTSGLEDVEPLFDSGDFIYFDRYMDGDPFNDDNYINNFHVVLKSLRECRKLKISYSNRTGRRVTGTYKPYRLEYSAKDDKFRLLTNGGNFDATINLGRITACEPLDEYDPSLLREPQREASVIFGLIDERNALERVMLHFSDCRKETRKIDDRHYNVTLWYDPQDETELLIRILSFGPMIRVTSPENFINLIKERVFKQQNFLKT